MTKFNETAAAASFIASAANRETSREIMEAIAFFARNEDEAEALWSGDFSGICDPIQLWENVTGNGRKEADLFVWGAEGSNWWDAIQAA